MVRGDAKLAHSQLTANKDLRPGLFVTGALGLAPTPGLLLCRARPAPCGAKHVGRFHDVAWHAEPAWHTAQHHAQGSAVKPDSKGPAPHGVAVYTKPLLARNATRLAHIEAEQLPMDKGMEEEEWEIGSLLWQLGLVP